MITNLLNSRVKELEGKLRQMHRRAQKAEGQRDRALHEVEAWQRVLGRTRGTGVHLIHSLSLTIVDSLQKVLTK